MEQTNAILAGFKDIFKDLVSKKNQCTKETVVSILIIYIIATVLLFCCCLYQQVCMFM